MCYTTGMEAHSGRVRRLGQCKVQGKPVPGDAFSYPPVALPQCAGLADSNGQTHGLVCRLVHCKNFWSATAFANTFKMDLAGVRALVQPDLSAR